MIRLRPYYLYTLFRQFASETPVDDNSLPDIAKRLVVSHFQEDITLVNTFCDACENCVKMRPDPDGSLWGDAHTCASTDTAARLNQVEDQMRSILYDLGLRFGDAVRADALLKLAAERRPFHYFHIPQWQADYERGVVRFSELTGIVPIIPSELLAKKRHYFKYADSDS